jgi:hypothetical protein
MINDSSKEFLDKFVASNPDLNVRETRDERWPTRWDKFVKGQPSMEITSEERRYNYM